MVFGTIVSGRPPELSGVEDMVGPLINAVPVRMQIKPGQTFSRFVQGVQASSLEGEPFHHVSLAEVQAHGPGRRRLFDHMVIFENYPLPSESTEADQPPTSGFAINTINVHDRTHYDLDVTVVPGEQISIQIAFNPDVYPPDQIARTADHFQTAIDSILRDPEQALGHVRLISDAEEHRVVNEFNNTATEFPQDKTIMELFHQHAEKTPHAVAVVAGEASLTYQELNARANRLAHYLLGNGVGPDVIVGICTKRGLDMIVGILGILKAGGAYLPLDPSYPQERLAFMLVDAKIPLLITHTSLLSGLPQHSVPVVCLDGDWQEISKFSERNPTRSARAADLVYVIYTSGSTGWPKGVLVEHRSLVNAASAWQSQYDLEQMDVRLLQIASMSFDIFAADFVRALTSGGQLIICPDDARVDPLSLYKLLAKHRVNIFEATPGLVIPLMDYVYKKHLQIDFLKVLILSSESLPAAHYRLLIERFGRDMRLVNGYGVTEATIDSSDYESPETAMPLGATTPIGKPLANTCCYVWDDQMRSVPIGMAGELFIGGQGVARGYLHRETLTAERFLRHPHDPRQRVYRTGDLVRWLPDGNLEFLGRVDDQMKLRGYRIEPGEIQNRLLAHSLVKNAAVVGREVPGAGMALVAYVVSEGDWSVAALRAFLETALPDYMVPNYFVRLDELPLTPNGKLDKRALPDPTSDTLGRAGQYVAPRNSWEEQLVDIWQHCLRIDRIGVDDNFFELGGHSLKAMQVVSRIHKQLGVRLKMRDFLAAQTIRELACRIRNGETATFESIQPVPVREYYELSHAQKRLWLLHQMDEAAAYNMPEAYRFRGAVDRPALQSAFAELFNRHEVLRTAFVTVDGEPRQKILPDVEFAVEEVDLQQAPDAEQQAVEMAHRIANAPFDLARPPLMRAALITLAPEHHVFIMTIHHIIGDGWSGNLLYREVTTLYEAYRRGLPNPLKPLRIQYKDFAEWQNAQSFESDEQYWCAKLSGTPEMIRLPYDLPLQKERNFRGSRESIVIGLDTLEGLREQALVASTSLSNVVLALFKLLLFHWTRQDDICVGVSIANRSHPDLENLLGFFVNVLPIRTQLSAESEFANLLDQVTRNMAEAFEHQNYPFDLMVQKLRPQRVANRQPLVNVLYGFQNFQDINIELDQFDRGTPPLMQGDSSSLVEVLPFEVSFDISKFDLTLFVSEQEDHLIVSLEYDTGVFLPKTIKRLARNFERFAQTVARDCKPAEGAK